LQGYLEIRACQLGSASITMKIAKNKMKQIREIIFENKEKKK